MLFRSLFEHLDKFIIADDATLEDVTGETICLGLEGPRAAEIAGTAGLPAPNPRYSHADWSGATVAAIWQPSVVTDQGLGLSRIHCFCR